MLAEQEPTIAASRSIELTTFGRVLMCVYIVAVVLVLPFGPVAKMMASSVFALIVMGGVGAWLTMRFLSLSAPGTILESALTPFTLRLQIVNRSRIRRARDVLVYIGAPLAAPRAASAHIQMLAPGEERTLNLRTSVRERGRHDRIEVQLSCSFPLGIVRQKANFSVPASLVITPRKGTLKSEPELALAHPSAATRARRSQNADDEFHSLLPWRPGLSQRRVNWRVSARMNQLMIQERESQSRPDLHIVLSTAVPQLTGLGQLHPGLELALSIVVTLADHYLTTGIGVRLSVVGEQVARRPLVRHPRQLQRLLEPTADARPHVELDPLPPEMLARSAATRANADECTIVVLASGLLGKSSANPIVRRGGIVVIDAASADIERVFSRIRMYAGTHRRAYS